MKILVVDDEPVARLILQKSIEKLGHEVVVARDGEEAWAAYLSRSFDVVVSDWMMPGMDGLQLTQLVREHQIPERGYAYIILVTALTEKKHFVEGMTRGADDFLTKPLDHEALEVSLIAAERVTSLHRLLTEQKQELLVLNEKLHEESRRDGLTRLRNRLCLQEDLRSIHDQCKRYGYAFAVALCDIDSYKKYNDHYGHLAGDEALKKVSKLLVDSSRASDTVYRYGGEEFLLILPDQDDTKAAFVMERVRSLVQAAALPHEHGPCGVITISVGVAHMIAGEDTLADTLLKRADEALYQAKDLGRNRVSLWHDGAPVPYQAGAAAPA